MLSLERQRRALESSDPRGKAGGSATGRGFARMRIVLVESSFQGVVQRTKAGGMPGSPGGCEIRPPSGGTAVSASVSSYIF